MNGKKVLSMLLCLGVMLLWASCANDEIKEIVQPEKPTEPVEPVPEPETSVEAKLPVLNVSGRYLKNEKGEIVNLHGFTQTYSPFFNNNAWGNYDVQACLSYNKRRGGSSISCVCTSTRIGAMTLPCSPCGMKDMNGSPKPVFGSISMNCSCRWRNTLFPRECTL